MANDVSCPGGSSSQPVGVGVVVCVELMCHDVIVIWCSC